MADRLSIDKKINDITIPIIDKTKFLGLDKSSVDRIELFLFAMALGVKVEKKTPISSLHGFILESSILNNEGAMSIIYSLLVDEMRKRNEEEKISDKDEAFAIAQAYANTGFNIINNWLSNIKKQDEESILWNLIDEMDTKYEECFQ
ncbi:MAG: hypothetical protein Q8865_03895 [Bacillota bacterium]|nr:hypothetical protein [Bacillota bacterium]